jgi:DNA polymerase-1
VKKLLAIDFSNLVIRHASNPYTANIVDLDGNPMGGAVGALKQVLRLVEREQPTHLLIARDSLRDELLRREIDPAYKAHRPAADDDLKRQFQAAYRGAVILGLPCVTHARHEADDVIASAAACFPGSTTIVSGDKDMLALVGGNVEVVLLRPGGERRCTSARDVVELFGVTPDRVRDFKSICGDASDGIKGVPGVGKGGATAILASCGSLAEAYRRLDAGELLADVKPAAQRKLLEGRAEARISWQLVGLVKTLAIDIDALLLAPVPPDITDALGDAGLVGLWSALPAAVALDAED